MKNTRMIISPGVLYTQHGRYRLVQSTPIKRDDYPYKLYDTFLVTPEEHSSLVIEVHVPEYALTVTDFEIAWVNQPIEIAMPKVNDPDYKLLIEDVETDQEPTVDFPADFEPKEMDCGV